MKQENVTIDPEMTKMVEHSNHIQGCKPKCVHTYGRVVTLSRETKTINWSKRKLLDRILPG
jgi:hypothetical protein